MLTLSKIILLLITSTLLKMSNPVKMSASLMLLSCLTFFSMSLEKSSVWMPMIFFMLFLGGILILFMILSSLSPNEKPKKLKSTTLLTTTSMVLMANFYQNQVEDSMLLTKTALSAPFTTASIVGLIMAYFMCFISVLVKSKNTLRSTLCQKKATL